jgi:hypothetical protein
MLLKISSFCTTHKSSASTGFTEQIMPILRNLCYNGSLVTWTVVGLTTAKFKPLIFSRSLPSNYIPCTVAVRTTQHRKHNSSIVVEACYHACLLRSPRHGPRTENTALLLLRGCLLGFPRDRYPASPLPRWLVPSNGRSTDTKRTPLLLLCTAPTVVCSFERVCWVVS